MFGSKIFNSLYVGVLNNANPKMLAVIFEADKFFMNLRPLISLIDLIALTILVAYFRMFWQIQFNTLKHCAENFPLTTAKPNCLPAVFIGANNAPAGVAIKIISNGAAYYGSGLFRAGS